MNEFDRLQLEEKQRRLAELARAEEEERERRRAAERAEAEAERLRAEAEAEAAQAAEQAAEEEAERRAAEEAARAARERAAFAGSPQRNATEATHDAHGVAPSPEPEDAVEAARASAGRTLDRAMRDPFTTAMFGGDAPRAQMTEFLIDRLEPEKQSDLAVRLLDRRPQGRAAAASGAVALLRLERGEEAVEDLVRSGDDPATAPSNAPFADKAQALAAMRDPRYSRGPTADPAFIAQTEARLVNSLAFRPEAQAAEAAALQAPVARTGASAPSRADPPSAPEPTRVRQVGDERAGADAPAPSRARVAPPLRTSAEGPSPALSGDAAPRAGSQPRPTSPDEHDLQAWRDEVASAEDALEALRRGFLAEPTRAGPDVRAVLFEQSRGLSNRRDRAASRLVAAEDARIDVALDAIADEVGPLRAQIAEIEAAVLPNEPSRRGQGNAARRRRNAILSALRGEEPDLQVRYLELKRQEAAFDSARTQLQERRAASFRDRRAQDERDAEIAERQARIRGLAPAADAEQSAAAAALAEYDQAADDLSDIAAELAPFRRAAGRDRHPNQAAARAALERLRPEYEAAAGALAAANDRLLGMEDAVDAYLGFERLDTTGQIIRGGWDAAIDEATFGLGSRITAARRAATSEVAFSDALETAEAEEAFFSQLNPGVDSGVRVPSQIARDIVLFAVTRRALGPARTVAGERVRDGVTEAAIGAAGSIASDGDPLIAATLGGTFGVLSRVPNAPFSQKPPRLRSNEELIDDGLERAEVEAALAGLGFDAPPVFHGIAPTDPARLEQRRLRRNEAQKKTRRARDERKRPRSKEAVLADVGDGKRAGTLGDDIIVGAADGIIYQKITDWPNETFARVYHPSGRVRHATLEELGASGAVVSERTVGVIRGLEFESRLAEALGAPKNEKDLVVQLGNETVRTRPDFWIAPQQSQHPDFRETGAILEATTQSRFSQEKRKQLEKMIRSAVKRDAEPFVLALPPNIKLPSALDEMIRNARGAVYRFDPDSRALSVDVDYRDLRGESR